ncbi:MAG TPA: hypothetical protein VFH43_00005 [Candidatus Kapabacteria bacterium]|nr:hypothetical protein [Candidatus Kapabacteria bacterium]
MTIAATTLSNTTHISPLNAMPQHVSFANTKQASKRSSFDTPGELTPEQLLFLTNFIKDTAFYVEQLESYIGEYLDEFWEDREYAYHLTTDLLIDQLQQQPLEER